MSPAADYTVVFEEPPAPLRVVGAPRSEPRRPKAVREQADRYVAPDSARPHGSYVKYVIEKCRCDSCRNANRAYEKRRQRAMRRPDEMWMPYVPAGPARRHIRELREAGVGLKTITKVSGLPHGGLAKLMYGDRARGMAPSKRIRPETARRILAVTVEAAVAERDGCKIPAGPTWALLDDLVGRGFTRTWIAQALGQKGPGLQIGRDRVRSSTARAVAALHERLDGVEPPPRRTRWSR